MHLLKNLSLIAAMYLAAADSASAAEYHDDNSLRKTLQSLDARSNIVSVEAFAQSRAGRSLWALTLAADGDGETDPADRPAMLIVAGIDGDRVADSAVAVGLAEALVEKHDSGDEAVDRFLTQHTLYIIPRLSADAEARFFTPPLWEHGFTRRPLDDDRDGRLDEDGPEDLNGDGLITQMRVADPDATHMVDADEPRLLRKADPDKGEVAVYKLYTEGVDNDGDGQYNEDPPGGVDLNANFPHGYVEHGPGAGPYQLCEPESRALIDFVFAHPRIAIALTLGRHNNLLDVKSDGKMDHTKEAPIELMKEDAPIYEHIAERFKELTGIEKGDTPDSGGAFYAWAYAQYGIPSFATSVWQRPKVEEPEEEDADGSEEGADVAKPDDDAEPDKKKRGRGKKSGGKEDKVLEEERAWLKYSDASRNGDGFVDWQPFDHPTLGDVEIGGFTPYFRTNPPPGDLDGIVEKQLAFVLDLATRFPSVAMKDVNIIEKHDGLFEIEAHLVNDGYFPTGLAIAEKTRRVRPIVVQLDIDPANLLGGERIHRIWRIPGSGGAYKLRWLVKAARGDTLTVRITSEKYGDADTTIKMENTAEGTE